MSRLSIAPVITIDGPSGVGKGTLCQAIAQRLAWHWLDSGAIYRVLALAARYYQVAIDSEEALVPLAVGLDMHFVVKHGQTSVLLNGTDVSQDIRNESVGHIASKIATLPHVREALLTRQRAFRVAPGLIADGRDMGTVVFPDAPIKIFLEASEEARAYRRRQQLQDNGFSVNFKRLLSDLQERDVRDRDRAVAPLIPANDALVLDSTSLTIDEVLVKALAHARQRLAFDEVIVKTLAHALQR